MPSSFPDRVPDGPRRGFVLPLALFMLLVIALLAALMLEGAIQELRLARGDVAAARAEAAAVSALSDFLSSQPDSALLGRPRGYATTSLSSAGSDSATATVQSLGSGILRVTATARAWSAGIRGDASHLGFVRIVADSAGPPGSLRYRRLTGWWWTQLP